MAIHVVIPCYRPDRAQLGRAIGSALACAGVERVTVVDDGSEPPVVLVDVDARVELVRQANAGPSAARNAGLERVRSGWALMLDDDDELIAEGVAAAVALAESLGAVGAIVGRIECGADGATRTREAPPEWSGRALPRPGDAFRPITLFNASGTLVARRAIEAGLRYDESLRIGEDREFVRRLAAFGPVAVAPGVAVRAGVRPGGERLTSSAHLERRAIDHMAIMDRWLDEGSEEHLRDGTRWLLNAMSRAGATGVPAYRRLMDRAVELGWIGRLDRMKHAMRGAFGGGGRRSER